MKSEIYNALASLNRGFDVTLESLKVLHEQGVVSQEFAQDQGIFIQELWAGINYMVVHKLNARETEDRQHFGRMRDTIEERRKHETTTATTSDSGTDARGTNEQRSQGGPESI